MARHIGFILGIALFSLTLLTPAPQGMSDAGWLTAGVGLLMACWWATEAIPVPMTSLLPVVLFPLLGLVSLKGATAPYANPIIYLLMGGFIIATALQRWNLHRRLALMVLRQVGNHPYAIIGGFMGVTAFLSMWISNTATTIMMIPIALSVATVLLDEQRGKAGNNFTICLVLGIAYSASIGGLGTLIGTPPNALVASFMAEHYGVDISFVQWMTIGLPVVILLVPAAWWLLTRVAYPFQLEHNNRAKTVVADELAAMGPITVPEQRVAIVFVLVALAWVFRPLLQQVPGLGGISDVIIAVLGAIALFVVPSGCRKESGTQLLDWQTASQIPWGVLLLFGGGLSLASMVGASGLAQWLGDALAHLSTFHMLVLIASLVTLVIFLTELTSNTATTATTAAGNGQHCRCGRPRPNAAGRTNGTGRQLRFYVACGDSPERHCFCHRQSNDSAKWPERGLWVNISGIVVISTLGYLSGAVATFLKTAFLKATCLRVTRLRSCYNAGSINCTHHYAHQQPFLKQAPLYRRGGMPALRRNGQNSRLPGRRR